MTQQEIKDTIKDLKEGLASSFTPEQFKPRMEAKIKELEAKLTDEKPVKKETPAPKKSAPSPEKKSKSVTLTDGKQKIEVDYIAKHPENVYEISKKVAKALLKSNKFNDDKWGQLFVSEEKNVNDEDPNWVFIEDTKNDELEQFDVLDEGAIFLTLGNGIKPFLPTTKTELREFLEVPEGKQAKVVKLKQPEPKKETPAPEKKKSVPQPKAKEEKYPEDEDDYCAKVIAQAKERRRKAKERAKLPQKSEATKNKEKLEKVFDNVKERAEDNNITKAELVKLISETKSLLTMLEKKLASL